MRKITQSLTLLLLAVTLPLSSLSTVTVDAASAADWRAGRIIDDGVFTNAADMSVGEIQNFLNNQVGTGGFASIPGQCDTQGSLSAQPYGSMTRAEYARSLGRSDKFTCLNSYYEVPKTTASPEQPASNYGGGAIPPGALSAAQIISNAAVKYNISPKVLLVKLATESPGPLTSDDWPFQKQYLYAMGAHCPDSGPGGSANCDVNWSGFSLQMDEAASLMRWYLDSMTQPWWQYKKPNQVNHILWNVAERGCGGSDVYIESKATAALYTYTPYQPNQAALNNMYGTGDNCSAYGNRNFWRVFVDWFGSTRVTAIPGCTEATNTSFSCVWRVRNNTANAEVISTSYAEVNDFVNNKGYEYLGKSFIVRNAIAPAVGNIPIYGLTKPDGSTFITASKPEYDSLSSSWTPKGTVFYADPANSNSGYNVYRLYSPTNGTHRWSGDSNEINNLIGNGYQVENLAFASMSPFVQETAPPTGKLLVYRFYIPQSYSHFWTTNVYERDAMIATGYQYEGVAWYSSVSTSDLPVYRLYAPSLRQHLYTTDVSERDNLSSSGGWNNEGTAFYVSRSGSSSVYRLYAPSLGVHHLTLDANERSVLLNRGGWMNEGTAWYQ